MKNIFLLLLGVCACVTSLTAHAFYVSVTKIKFDSKKQQLTVSVRIFTDDLQDAVRRDTGNKELVIMPNKAPKGHEVFIQKYL